MQKDLVFSILTARQPLSTIEIVNIIHKQYNISLTYQAVKKAIDSLIIKKVIKKDGKFLSISKEWLINLKTNIDKLLTNYETGIVAHSFKAEILDKESSVYTFTNLIDLDNFWDDMLVHLEDCLKEDEPKIFITANHYPWFMLINLGKETKTFSYMHKKGIQNYTLHPSKAPLTKWGKHIYEEVGFKFKIIEDKNAKDSVNLNVIGDTVIQVTYSENIMKKIRDIYKKYKSINEIGMQEIARLANYPCELRFTVFKNPSIAESLRTKYLAYFY